MDRLRRWIETRKPKAPPSDDNAEAEHTAARQHAFWASERLLDDLRELECVAETIRNDRQERRGR